MGEASDKCSLGIMWCQTRGSAGDARRECSVCCGDNFCTGDLLTGGVKEPNHATATLASIMLLVGSVSTTIALL